MKVKTVRIIQQGDIEWTEIDEAILIGIALGKTSYSIGIENKLSKRTVETYVNDMIDLLEVENRTALVCKAIALGIIENPYLK